LTPIHGRTLKAGAEINARDEKGQTPLMKAAMLNENPESILFFLKAGADATLKDNRGERAIDLAEENEAVKDTDAYWKLDDASF
jgi:ankyrin repeat protein